MAKVDADGTELATEEDVTKVIGKKQLKDLLSLLDDIDDTTAESRKKATDAVEDLRVNKHVHVDKWAVGVIRYLRKLTTEKMADKIDVLEYYLDASGLTDKAKKVQRLPLDGDHQRQAPKGNVTPMRQAAE